MNRGHFYKLLLILFILAWSFYSMYPPTGRNLYEVFVEKSFKQDAAYTNLIAEYKSLAKKNPERRRTLSAPTAICVPPSARMTSLAISLTMMPRRRRIQRSSS
ncbi:MAG: hypothetical protein NTW03_04890 [Verrucomicrobia bacterium]|nr:hypothetical protein [Verrucomicrobiota bacterium]